MVGQAMLALHIHCGIIFIGVVLFNRFANKISKSFMRCSMNY